jgi:hypothetical protein
MERISLMPNESQIGQINRQVLSLIKEQLKSNRFFNALRSLGLTDNAGEVRLESIIAQSFGVSEDDHQAILFTTAILDKHSFDFTSDLESLERAASEVYWELLIGLRSGRSSLDVRDSLAQFGL